MKFYAAYGVCARRGAKSDQMEIVEKQLVEGANASIDKLRTHTNVTYVPFTLAETIAARSETSLAALRMSVEEAPFEGVTAPLNVLVAGNLSSLVALVDNDYYLANLSLFSSFDFADLVADGPCPGACTSMSGKALGYEAGVVTADGTSFDVKQCIPCSNGFFYICGGTGPSVGSLLARMAEIPEISLVYEATSASVFADDFETIVCPSNLFYESERFNASNIAKMTSMQSSMADSVVLTSLEGNQIEVDAYDGGIAVYVLGDVFRVERKLFFPEGIVIIVDSFVAVPSGSGSLAVA